MRKLIPVILAVAALGGGLATGYFARAYLSPSETEAAEACPEGAADCTDAEAKDEPVALPTEYVKFANQFIVPLIQKDGISAMVVLSLSVEVSEGSKETIYNREPKLRDAFLRVLFDHANAGGFEGNFLSSAGLDGLRMALREIGQKTAGPIVHDVLIIDLVKQKV
ncbi:flagellar basal body-associated FliL family protein [Fluviibacterium sp. S390]|uniref:flagellar basal body-associated FliL family protein n=1 Tax=Fluviibacterium sp. S390 TaxID=3415139 RepID=UPI003C7EA4B3